MTDFLDRLERQLVGTVERHAAGPALAERQAPSPRRRPAGWRGFLGLRHRPLLVALAVIVLGGTATAAVVSLSASRPLRGTIPPGGALAPFPSSPAHYRIAAFPYMAVGWAGWCTSVDFLDLRGREASFYGCAPIESGSDPSVGGMLFGRYQYEIVRQQVAAIRFSFGRTITPVTDPGLPPGMRGYMIIGPKTTSSQEGGAPWSRVLLDARGHPIVEPNLTRAANVEHLPIRILDASRPGSVPCAVLSRRVSGLTPIAQTVSTPVPWPREADGAFEACANATFRVDHGIVAVAVLINAVDPAKTAPDLPELAPLTGHPGLLTGVQLGTVGFPEGLGVGDANPTTHVRSFMLGPGTQPNYGAPAGILALSNTDITARRAGNAWVIAEGGTPIDRVRLLAALTVVPVR